MNKELKFEPIKDKVFKKEVDNLILVIETAALLRPLNLEDLRKQVKNIDNTVKTLTEMKKLPTTNDYANQIITNAELDLVKAEEQINNYEIGGVSYIKFQEQLKNNYAGIDEKTRLYNIPFFENIINLAKMYKLTNELSEEEMLLRTQLIEKNKKLNESEEQKDVKENKVS